jgi:hypothetical protein
MLRYGEWEAGHEFAHSLMGDYHRALHSSPYIEVTASASATATATAAVVVPREPSPTSSMSHLSSMLRSVPHVALSTRTSTSTFTTPDLPALQRHTLGDERLHTLCSEMKRTADTFEDRLRHEGNVRTPALHYAVRFMTAPWTRSSSDLESGPNSTSSAGNKKKTLQALAAACGYPFVSVVAAHCNTDSDTDAGAGAAAAAGAEETKRRDRSMEAALGIREDEVWLLLKYDSAVFSHEEDEDEDEDEPEKEEEGGLACTTRTLRYLQQLEACHGPIGSLSRLSHQVCSILLCVSLLLVLVWFRFLCLHVSLLVYLHLTFSSSILLFSGIRGVP